MIQNKRVITWLIRRCHGRSRRPPSARRWRRSWGTREPGKRSTSWSVDCCCYCCDVQVKRPGRWMRPNRANLPSSCRRFRRPSVAPDFLKHQIKLQVGRTHLSIALLMRYKMSFGLNLIRCIVWPQIDKNYQQSPEGAIFSVSFHYFTAKHFDQSLRVKKQSCRAF